MWCKQFTTANNAKVLSIGSLSLDKLFVLLDARSNFGATEYPLAPAVSAALGFHRQ
jgi:hypothetical protein